MIYHIFVFTLNFTEIRIKQLLLLDFVIFGRPWDLSILYLAMLQGIPESAEAPPVNGTSPSGPATDPPVQPQQTTQAAPVPATGPNANPLDLFPRVYWQNPFDLAV